MTALPGEEKYNGGSDLGDLVNRFEAALIGHQKIDAMVREFIDSAYQAIAKTIDVQDALNDRQDELANRIQALEDKLNDVPTGGLRNG